MLGCRGELGEQALRAQGRPQPGQQLPLGRASQRKLGSGAGGGAGRGGRCRLLLRPPTCSLEPSFLQSRWEAQVSGRRRGRRRTELGVHGGRSITALPPRPECPETTRHRDPAHSSQTCRSSVRSRGRAVGLRAEADVGHSFPADVGGPPASQVLGRPHPPGCYRVPSPGSAVRLGKIQIMSNSLFLN